MKDGFGEITEEITDERKDYISYKMEIIFLRCDRICSDVCISVTGIAGPGGGSEEKPVGLVYIGFSYGDKKICKKIQMRNVNRSWNRHYTLLCMLNVIYRNI